MILEIQELSKEFIKKDDKICAVDQASFQVKSGELASIIGHSGSGKSTLFHLITGLLKPNTGKIIFDQIDINTQGSKELTNLRNNKIGYVLQEENLLKNFTVLENVCMPYFINHGGDNTICEKAEKILDMVGLLEHKDSFPNEISGGEARRVAIARALINDPEIIIADEPTSNLDPDNSTRIMMLFREISDSGVAVIISTHDLEFLKYSDKVYLMNKGKLEEINNIQKRG